MAKTPNDVEWENLMRFWKGCCAYCGRKLIAPPNIPQGVRIPRVEIATRDHFVPRALGGVGQTEVGNKPTRNMVLSCVECNDRKAHLDPRRIVEVWHKLDRHGLMAVLIELDMKKRRKR